ncbi:MAG: winged helix-turn-helix transcriptional regulator [Pirellulaceae bacterium]|nr:winged helix-turn-helix transcriptional regulator [Pirellulaceae bacterium]
MAASKRRNRPAQSADDASPAPAHPKIRSDHSIEVAEDYAEAIYETIQQTGRCRAVDLARRFSVSAVTVNRTVGRLVRDGLVLTEPYGPLELTTSGRKLAAAAQHRHAMMYGLLIAIGVDQETATIDSEGMEHHASPKTLQAIQRFLKNLRDGKV